MQRYPLTGAAGFIASKVAELLLAENHRVIGVDNLNNAYDVRLKQWRLARLESHRGFEFHQLDITNWEALHTLFEPASDDRSNTPKFDAVINLAARAGVRQSVENPWIYIDTREIRITYFTEPEMPF